MWRGREGKGIPLLQDLSSRLAESSRERSLPEPLVFQNDFRHLRSSPRLGVQDISIAVVVVFGVRIFQNLAAIRRILFHA